MFIVRVSFRNVYVILFVIVSDLAKKLEYRFHFDIAQIMSSSIGQCYLCQFINEPRHEKTGFLPMRKQRRR